MESGILGMTNVGTMIISIRKGTSFHHLMDATSVTAKMVGSAAPREPAPCAKLWVVRMPAPLVFSHFTLGTESTRAAPRWNPAQTDVLGAPLRQMTMVTTSLVTPGVTVPGGAARAASPPVGLMLVCPVSFPSYSRGGVTPSAPWSMPRTVGLGVPRGQTAADTMWVERETGATVLTMVATQSS